ncbi:MAG: UDP-glucose/GDP-mannose dehydrogenase family protein [Elusimicrobiota bacterium]|jgi:UDPglucose 6-dehydrogenase|nr:UDP-glucose/GDP-mannose dehydrogenase family protein [Elusimicrobiota bacterium]
MKVAVIGTGYVGLPTGVGLAEIGHSVVCIDMDKCKIDALRKGEITIFENGLEELFRKNLNDGKIKFSNSMKEGVEDADIIIVAVGTPPHPVTKEADLKYIYAAVTEVADYLNKYTIIAIKSTVPVGTGDDIETIINNRNPKADFAVVSLPEFLREGLAVYDFFHPDRIIIGANTQRAKDKVKEMYSYFQDKTEILFVKRRSSETIKYASNSFLAVKIHYINEMADFCEKIGADISEVAKGMSLDTRIGAKFLNSGPGYGGSCFPKDTQAMAYMGKMNDINLSLIESAIKGNIARKKSMAKRILKSVVDIKDPKIAFLGLAFKSGTDDCRESPSIVILKELLDKNANIKITAFDPKAVENAKTLLGNVVLYADNIEEALKGADIMVIATEWEDFKKIDLEKAKISMRNRRILDLRNILDEQKAVQLGFEYKRIGK